MDKKIITTITLDADKRATDLLANMPHWAEARKRLIGILDKAEEGTVAEFFSSKVNGKGASFSYQTLANVTFTSAGYVRDKWTKYENEALKASKQPSVYDFLCNNLVPLTEEELKALAEKQKHETEVTAKAQAYIESCDLMDIRISAEIVRNNTKLLARFGQEVIDKIIELLEKSKDSADESAEV